MVRVYMKPILYFITGVGIGVGSMVFKDRWETIRFRHGMIEYQDSLVAAKRLGDFQVTLWDRGRGLAIATGEGARHSIWITSATPTNPGSPCISLVEIDDCYAFNDADCDGAWDGWHFKPNYDEWYAYSGDSGIPGWMSNSNGLYAWIGDQFHEVLNNGTNLYVVLNDQEVPVEFLKNGMIGMNKENGR